MYFFSFLPPVWESFVPFDLQIQSWVQTHQTIWVTRFFQYITHLGSPMAFAMLTIISILLLLYRRQIKEVIFLNVSLFSSWILMSYLKELFERSRPEGNVLTIATGYSFPSGHASVSIAFYGFLAYVLMQAAGRWNRRGAIFLGGLVVIIGISRIYLNVHYFSDVLGGFILGGLCLYGSIKAFRSFS